MSSMFGHSVLQTSVRAQVGFNTAFQLIGKTVSAGMTLLVTFLLARQFGAEGYGDFVKVITYVGFFFLLADFGLNATFLQQDNKSLAALFGIRVVTGGALVFCALALLAFVPHGSESGYTTAVRLGIVVFAPAIFFQSLITTANAVFQKHLRYDLTTVSVTAGSTLTIIVLGAILFGNIPASIAGSVPFLAGSIMTAAVALWFCAHITPLSVAFVPRDMVRLFIPTIPLGLTLISNVIYAHADSVILTLTRPTLEVGTYGFAYKIFETLLVIPTFFMNAVYPLLLREKIYSVKFMMLIKKSSLFMICASVIVCIFVWVMAPLMLHIKSDFSASVMYVRILSLSFPFFFLSSLVMWVLITLKKQWMLAGFYIVSMAANILMNIWLIPVHGALAAAWITVISEGVVLVVSSTALLRYIRIHNTVGVK